jgi:alkylation response protein AidB-like acyl-CoA dehydrogenase
MEHTPDPLAIAASLRPLIEATRDGYDTARRLPTEVADALAASGLFRLWLPRSLGGHEVPPRPLFEGLEALAILDSSVGWCASIAAGYARLAGSMDPDAARAVFHAGRGIVAGSLNPTGRAAPVPGGYRVSGRWSYGSFIDHADWVLGNCVMHDANGPRQAADGGPDFHLVMIPRAQVEVIDVWHVTGLRGTGSHDYQVENLFVSEAFCIPFPGFHPQQKHPGALYALPQPSAFVSLIAINLLGMARAALDALVELAGTKITAGVGAPLRDKAIAHIELARAEAMLGGGRAWLFEAIEGVWETVKRGEAVGMRQRALTRLAAVNAGQQAIAAVDLAHQLAGGAALVQGTRLERCFRDIHAAGAHVVMSPQVNFEPIGRVLFGLPPGMARF